MAVSTSWETIGRRIREARRAAGLTQQQLAERSHFERTQLGKVESGTRQVSAVEIFALADSLRMSPTYFMTDPLPAVASRRQGLDEDADSASRRRFRLDAQLEEWARDVQWLIDGGYLVPPKPLITDAPTVSSASDARQFGVRVRELMGLGVAPLQDMADVCEEAGLYLAVSEGDVGASLLLDLTALYGVALVGFEAPPGRRRATAAHELGHHFLRDEYQTDAGVAASRDQREELIDAFAAEFLLPTAVVQATLTQESDSARRRFIHLAAEYRVSWTVVTRAVAQTDTGLAQQLSREAPQYGDFLEVVGAEPPEDLRKEAAGREYRKAVFAAWRDDAIASSRAVQLLRGAVTSEDFPDRA